MSFFFPLAAAALAVSGVAGASAHVPPPFLHDRAHPMPMHAPLTDAQKAAFEKARSLFEAGDKEAAKQTLKDAGFPERGPGPMHSRHLKGAEKPAV